MSKKIDLIGDGIENPHNAKVMLNIATMFASKCFFRDRKKLAPLLEEDNDVLSENIKESFISPESIAENYQLLLALENTPNAADIYGFQIASGKTIALIAGNERFGISHELLKASNQAVQIPMPGPDLNTLNVAAASGVALFYLCSGAGGKLQVRAQPAKRRPEVLFMGVADHNELGSSIRSAGAFGWSRLFVEDRDKIWFGCDRITRSEGRGAARRGRNSIHLVPVQKQNRYSFKDVLVVSTRKGDPILRSDLAKGAEQLIVVPDESNVDVSAEDWERLGNSVRFVQIELPVDDFTYHFRIFASIALAEASRQIGRKSGAPTGRRERRGPVYESSLSLALEEFGEEIHLEDLELY